MKSHRPARRPSAEARRGRCGWLNSARRSPDVLVFRTVHETFALIRLLEWPILVRDTFRRFDRTLSVYCIMTVPVQGCQVALLVVRGVTIVVMFLDDVAWHEVQATAGT